MLPLDRAQQIALAVRDAGGRALIGGGGGRDRMMGGDAPKNVSLDPLTEEIFDPFDGAGDLERRRLRVVDPRTFSDDSLRVLRAVQFAARFRFALEPSSAELCRRIALDDLPAERVWGEFEKLLN